MILFEVNNTLRREEQFRKYLLLCGS